MIYVLDTNICVYFLNGTFPSLAEEMARHASAHLAITSISAAELFYGAYHSAKPARNLESLQVFFSDLQILLFDSTAAREFGRLKEHARRAGKLPGPFDLLIASIVRSLGYTLVTHNVKEFSMLENLLITDWVR